MRRATRDSRNSQNINRISIHALLAESDPSKTRRLTNLMISIHALLAESDRYSLRHSAQSGYFYPRSPCGERPRIFLDLTFHKNFYPRSPCGERPRVVTAFWGSVDNFYPRSPCGERRCRPGNCTRCCAFLSTLSLRRATNTNLGRHRGNDDFYPRSPCGERPWQAPA